MVDSKLVKAGAGVVGDIMSAMSVPGGNTLAVLADGWIQKRTKEATDVFIEEISDGYHGPIEFTKDDLDPVLEIVHRFNKAVEDGAAIENLRLLAQVIAGLKKKKALNGDDFRRWAAMLEQATRDELVMIGFSYTVYKTGRQLGGDAENQFWKHAQGAMEQAGYSQQEVLSIAASVSRYGLLIPTSAFGAFVYIASPWLAELGELANTESMRQFSRKS